MRVMSWLYFAGIFAFCWWVWGLLSPQPAAAEDIGAIRDDIAALISAGHEMSPLRESSDSGDVAQCMSLMDRHQPQAEQLRERISAQPDSNFTFHLSMTSTDLRRCVSCTPGAESSCDDAATLLDEADQLR